MSIYTERPWIEHYDPGVPGSIQYPQHNLQAFLEASAGSYPDRPCTIFRDSIISYGLMNVLANRVAQGLASMGIGKGDRVGILMPNMPQFIMAFYGILKAGAVVMATNPLYTSDEIEHQLNDSGTELIFVASSLYTAVALNRGPSGARRFIVVHTEDGQPVAPGSRAVNDQPAQKRPGDPAASEVGDVMLRDFLGAASETAPPIANVGPDDTALFQYSGGTTGVSKAAIATHRGVVANTIQFRRWLVTLEDAKEVMLLAIPLYHAYGMIAGMSLAVAIGASIVPVPNPRDMDSLLEAIKLTRPTVFPGVPALYNGLSNHPDVAEQRVSLSSIRVCISGSTALMRETKERFEKLSGGKIVEGYGLSEAPVVTHCNPLLGENKIGSIGMPMPDVECRVVEADNPERDVAVGASGELLLRGPQLMKGYHNMPSESANVLRMLGDGKTWLFTGDVVRMDQDGYFHVVDRKKELIKPGGFQVWPREVEEALASHPAVLEAGVAGVPDPDRGEAVKAWIVLRSGMTASADELREWCRTRLAPYKTPSLIVFRSRLPKSNVGKILRRELVREHVESPDPAS